jgi:hypothetical protein
LEHSHPGACAGRQQKHDSAGGETSAVRSALHSHQFSWLNLVERWFGELSQKAVRRGVFGSVADLEQAIQGFMQAWNANPTPIVWTATVEIKSA